MGGAEVEGGQKEGETPLKSSKLSWPIEGNRLWVGVP